MTCSPEAPLFPKGSIASVDPRVCRRPRVCAWSTIHGLVLQKRFSILLRLVSALELIVASLYDDDDVWWRCMMMMVMMMIMMMLMTTNSFLFRSPFPGSRPHYPASVPSSGPVLGRAGDSVWCCPDTRPETIDWSYQLPIVRNASRI